MDSIKKAKSRIAQYPKLLVDCSVEARGYAVCVFANESNLKQNVCETEFVAFKNCLIKSAVDKLKTKI